MELNQTRYMNKEQQQIIDEAYKNWCKQFEVDPNNFNVDELVKGHGDQCWGYPILDHVKPTSKEYKRGQINAYLEGKAEKPFFYLTQEEFINKCKTNPEFSERWGLKIEERELSLEERSIIAGSNHYEVSQNIKMFVGWDDDHTLHENLDDNNVPTKLITITYNDKTIESYRPDCFILNNYQSHPAIKAPLSN
jgi:hypothetical protein